MATWKITGKRKVTPICLDVDDESTRPEGTFPPAAIEPVIWLNSDEDEGELPCGCRLHRNYLGLDDPAFVPCKKHFETLS